jgi:hypothetical protein
MKTILAQFDTVDFTEEKYRQTLKDLEDAGQGNPPGRLLHVISPQTIGMLVTDVWESEEQLNEFAKTLTPILTKNGVTPAQPTIRPVTNMIVGHLLPA